MLLALLLAMATATPAAAVPSPTPVPLYVIRPPAGWRQVQVSSDAGDRSEILDISIGPSERGAESTLNVLRQPLNDPTVPLAQWAKESVRYLASDQHTSILASGPHRVCNGTRDGWLIATKGRVNERDIEMVQAMLLDGGYEYVATYSRPAGAAADPAAMRALDTLCPQPG